MTDIIKVVEPGADDGDFKRIVVEDGPVLGAWYWVLPAEEETDDPDDRKPEWLGCAMKLGSNFVEVHSPHTESGHSYVRVHFDDFIARLRHEPRADEVIRGRIGHWQGESRRLLADIERVTRSLGMTPQGKIGGPAAQGAAAGGELMVLSSQADPKSYSNALTLAKEETLPALFKEMKDAHFNLAKWMKAPVMETLAQLRDQKTLIADIDDRIFSVSLYAGLTEETVKVADGAPATLDDKLHVMQRMAFMDEECLAQYKAGGMEFKDIGAFDAWLAEPENLARIFPFPRTIVAFRVRCSAKSRDWMGSVGMLKMNFEKEQLDKATFLYIRNGEQLWRLSTDIDFGELIFPDASVFDPGEPKMVRMFAGSVRDFVSRHWWEGERDRQLAAKAAHEAWRVAPENAGKSWMDNPHRGWFSDRYSDYHPVDPSSVYYDDAMAKIEKEVKLYNRVALIIQGLFDRSMVLHPHLPARTWSADGFDAAVKLVYDGTGTLYNGEAPDFEAYRARCNASLRAGSLVIGQEDAWLRAEGKKESARRDRDWRDKSEYRPERFKPYGNPGPGYMTRIAKWTRTGKATFNWMRDRQGPTTWRKPDEIACSITVSAADLFNVDAYKPGDFKQFFTDPRTRAEYLKWAPMLIAAEEHHASIAKGQA